MADKQFNNRDEWDEEIGVEYRDKADELSLRIFHLKNIAALASFATEARRTLTGIDDVTHFRPEMQKAISDGVQCASSWSERSDVAGDVLDWLVTQMDDINTEVTSSMYAMSRGEKLCEKTAAA